VLELESRYAFAPINLKSGCHSANHMYLFLQTTNRIRPSICIHLTRNEEGGESWLYGSGKHKPTVWKSHAKLTNGAPARSNMQSKRQTVTLGNETLAMNIPVSQNKNMNKAAYKLIKTKLTQSYGLSFIFILFVFQLQFGAVLRNKKHKLCTFIRLWSPNPSDI
jgi:hypothetical protein